MRATALRGVALVGLLLVALTGDARAVDVNIGAEVIDQAIEFSRGASRKERQAFHDPYLRMPGDAVRKLSLVTEYRRVVLRVEEHMRILNRNYGVRQMIDELKPWRGLIEVIVELQFHPQNTYVHVPIIDVLLVPLEERGALPLVAETTNRLPQYGTFWAPPPPDSPWWPFPPPNSVVIPGSEPLTGAWIQARFDAAQLGHGRYDVVVKDGGKTLATGTFDLGELR